MPNTYTNSELLSLAGKFQCASANIGFKAMKAEKYGMPDKECFKQKMYFLNNAVCLISEYLQGDTCLSDDELFNVVEVGRSLLDCPDCEPNVLISGPIVSSHAIYYGNSLLLSLTAAEVQLLTLTTQTTFAADYFFPATSPSEYKYLAYPALLGLPTTITDALTDLDMVMDIPYQVTINSIIYNVYRTYYPLGGELTITLT